MSTNGTAAIPRSREVAGRLADEALGIVSGVGFTFALFAVIAHFEGSGTAAAPEEIEDLRPMSIPFDAPPPKVVETPQVVAPAMPLSGIEVAASESPVKISVLAPDLAALMPDVQVAPSATIQPARLYTGFKPQIETGTGDFMRVFQQYEVDQRPTVLSRPNPHVPKFIRGKAKTLRVSLLIIVDTKGGVDSVRVLESSGNPEFDAIVIRDVREAWLFTPASKNGRNVRCLLQQSVRVNWDAGSPFER